MKSSYSEKYIEAGLDEVGRGCLAGPVVAAAVILPPNYIHPYLTDSKKLNLEQRNLLEQEIKQQALAWAIAEASPTEIDTINILQASFLAMHRALDALCSQCIPELLLVDGNRFKKYKTFTHECIIKGDGLYYSIAAASVLAKTYRDQLMKNLALVHPYYGWHTNVGYPTVHHRKAITQYGLTEHHRQSFKCLE